LLIPSFIILPQESNKPRIGYDLDFFSFLLQFLYIKHMEFVNLKVR